MHLKTLSLIVLTIALTACQAQRPSFSSIDRTLAKNSNEPLIATPIMIPEPPKPAPGSLWQPGNKQFFKDSRANKVGDMVTIVVKETAEAESEANTETTKTHNNNSDINNLANLEGILSGRHIINAAGNLLSTDSNRTFTGEGSTDRKDSLSANVAAIVTQVLPNGYLVIQGKREIVINYELQEMQIKGIVRPEDISAQNTIPSNKIAEARIFYAGKGVVDDTQTPQYGVQFMNKILPF